MEGERVYVLFVQSKWQADDAVKNKEKRTSMLSTKTKTCRVIVLHVAPAKRKEIKRQKKNQVHCSLVGRKKRGKQATKMSSICICSKSVQKTTTIRHRFQPPKE